MVDFCAESELSVNISTHFKHKYIHKSITVETSRVGMELKFMIDLVIIKTDILKYVYVVKMIRQLGLGISDNTKLLFKLKTVI